MRACRWPAPAAASLTSFSNVCSPATGKITSRTTPSGLSSAARATLKEDADLAANLNRISEQFLDDALLGLDCDPVRNLDQQLDQTVDDLGLAGQAVEGQQRQTGALWMTAQFPGGLDRGAPAEPLDEIGVNTAQQVSRQRERADKVKLVNLGEQALQADAPRIGRQPGERRSCAVVRQRAIQTLVHLGIEAIGDGSQDVVVVHGTSRVDDPVEAVGAWPDDAPTRKPRTDLVLERGRVRLALQHLLSQPSA